MYRPLFLVKIGGNFLFAVSRQNKVDFGKGRGNGARPFSAVPLEPVVRERQGRAICCRGLCRPLSPLYEVGYDALDEL